LFGCGRYDRSIAGGALDRLPPGNTIPSRGLFGVIRFGLKSIQPLFALSFAIAAE
jgi:hypothetical protein